MDECLSPGFGEQWLYRSHLDRPLWPELVEEDYDQVRNLTAEYALHVAGTAYFTSDALRDYLESLEYRAIWLPADPDEWQTLFAEMRTDIQQRLLDSGRRYRWVESEDKNEVRYALARWVSLEEFNALGDVAVREPAAEPIPSAAPPTARRALVEVVPPAPPVSARAANPIGAVVNRLFGEQVRRQRLNKLVPEVSRILRLDEAAARVAIDGAVADGILFRHNAGGNVWYTPHQSETPQPARGNGGAERRERARRSLNERELAIAIETISVLAHQTRYAEQGQTVRTLLHALRGKLGRSLNTTQLNKVIRAMQTVDLVAYDIPGSSKRVRTSPRVRISQGMKADWVAGDTEVYIQILREDAVIAP